MSENHSPEKDPYEEFSKLAKDLKEQANTEGLLKALEEISLHIRKQDGQNHDLINLLGKMDKEFPDLTATLKQLAETQPEILERLDKIEKNNRPKSLKYKFAVGAAKFPLQVIGGIFKTIGIAAIPPILAASVYVGNGNDPMDIPCNLKNWSDKHFSAKSSLSQFLQSACSNNNIAPENFDPSHLPDVPHAPFDNNEGIQPAPNEDGMTFG